MFQPGQPPPGQTYDRQPKRSFVMALSMGIWTVVFAAASADLILDFGLPGPVLARVLGHFFACAFGVLMCILLSLFLKRSLFGLPHAAAFLLLISCLAAILWTVFARLVFYPLSVLLVESFRRPELSGESPIHLPVFWIALVFCVWAGAWLAVTYAEELRGAESKLEAQRSRILKLEAFLGATGERLSPAQHFWVPSRFGSARISTASIVCLQAERDYVRIMTQEGGAYLVRATLEKLTRELDPTIFLRVHRSTVVNVNEVLQVAAAGTDGLSLRLSNHTTVAVSRRFAPSVRKRIMDAAIRQPRAADRPNSPV